MESIRELSREHAAIEGMLARFARTIGDAARGCRIEPEPVERMLAFLEREVDGHHQEKEERVLLPRIVERARGEDLECARTTLREHLDERKLLARMRNSVEGACRREPGSIAALVRYARIYLTAQLAHARWEESVLYPLAERILGPDDDRAMAREFRRLDELWGTRIPDAARNLAAWLDARAPRGEEGARRPRGAERLHPSWLDAARAGCDARAHAAADECVSTVRRVRA